MHSKHCKRNDHRLFYLFPITAKKNTHKLSDLTELKFILNLFSYGSKIHIKVLQSKH